MLQVTDQAAAMIEQLATDRPEGTGLRIAQRDDAPSLAMELVDAPSPDDVVVPLEQAVVFLGPVAAARLDAQVLDARTGDNGSAFFLAR